MSHIRRKKLKICKCLQNALFGSGLIRTSIIKNVQQQILTSGFFITKIVGSQKG